MNDLTESEKQKLINDFNNVGEKMAQTLKEYLIYEYKKNLANAFCYLRFLDSDVADKVLETVPEELRLDLTDYSEGKKITDLNVQCAAAYALNSNGFNSSDVMDGIRKMFPSKSAVRKMEDELYEKNPLLVCLIEKDDEFGYYVSKLSARDLSCIINDCSYYTVMKAFHGSSDDVKGKLMKSVSKNTWKMYQDDFKSLSISQEQIETCQEEIVSKIQCRINRGYIDLDY